MQILLFILFFIHTQAFADITSLAWKITSNRIKDSGTGFFISPNQFVTNFHVLESFFQEAQSLSDIRIVQNTNTHRVEKIISISALHDLAILQTSQSVNFYAKTNKELPYSHQPLAVVGYPQGRLKIIKQIGQITFHKNQGVNIPLDAHSSLKGVSGAPIINARNEVVGIVSEMLFNILHSIITIDQLNSVKKGMHSINRCNNCLPEEWINQATRQLFHLAKAGNTKAQYKLGLYYFEGVAVKQSTPKAKKWYRRAAKKGYIHAQGRLGNLLLLENMNNTEGLRWLRQAAEENWILGFFLLDRMIIEFKENSFAESDWKNKHKELLEKIRSHKLYIPDEAPLMNSYSNLCRLFFSN